MRNTQRRVRNGAPKRSRSKAGRYKLWKRVLPGAGADHPEELSARRSSGSCATARALMSRVAASPGVLQHVAPRNPRTEPMGATSPLAGTPSWSPRSPRSTSSFRGSRRIHSARSAVDEVSGRAPLQRAGSGFARRCGRRSLPPSLSCPVCASRAAQTLIMLAAVRGVQSPPPLPVLPSLPQLSGWTAAPSTSMPDQTAQRQYPFSSQHLGVLFSMLQDMRCVRPPAALVARFASMRPGV